MTTKISEKWLAKLKVKYTLYYDADEGSYDDDKDACFQYEDYPIIKRNTTLYLFEEKDSEDFKYVLKTKNGYVKLYAKSIMNTLDSQWFDILDTTKNGIDKYYAELYECY